VTHPDSNDSGDTGGRDGGIDDGRTRRRFVALASTAATVAVAGCFDGGEDASEGEETLTADEEEDVNETTGTADTNETEVDDQNRGQEGEGPHNETGDDEETGQPTDTEEAG